MELETPEGQFNWKGKESQLTWSLFTFWMLDTTEKLFWNEVIHPTEPIKHLRRVVR